jgi:hypothetical protein
MNLDARLLRLEHVHAVAERAQWRASRARLAQLFLDEGDPAENPTFAELTHVEQVRWAWLYTAWRTTPSGFLDGLLPEHLAPEPARPDGAP